jgi:hypothetical protein
MLKFGSQRIPDSHLQQVLNEKPGQDHPGKNRRIEGDPNIPVLEELSMKNVNNSSLTLSEPSFTVSNVNEKPEPGSSGTGYSKIGCLAAPILAYPHEKSIKNDRLTAVDAMPYEAGYIPSGVHTPLEDTSSSLTIDSECDIVRDINKKPEPASSGQETSMIGSSLPPIIADSPLAKNDKDFIDDGVTMSEGYVKLKREALELLCNDPDAFLLLTLIALRIKRTDSKYANKKLKIGEAMIGDYRTIGLTRKRYRRAINKLIELQIGAFKGANKGTIATLLNSDIYDVNLEAEGPTKGPAEGQQRATKGATNKKIKNERKKEEEEKSKRPPAPPPAPDSLSSKSAFGEHGNVLLTAEQHQKLLEINGPEDTAWMIQKLDVSIPNAKRPYKSHYHTMCRKGWVNDALLEHKEKGNSAVKPGYSSARKFKISSQEGLERTL